MREWLGLGFELLIFGRKGVCNSAHICQRGGFPFPPMLSALLLIAAAGLSYATGANANFKGVASLYGSGTTTYRTAVWWAAVTTAAGSLAALFLADTMLKNFSGRGLVPETLAGQPAFLLAVALGAAGTMILATWLGFPVSSTHSLTGALVGAGLMHDAAGVSFTKLWDAFARPLLLAPVLAIVLGAVVYLVLRLVRLAPDHRTRTLDACHFTTAGAVCFARGLNDTPKAAALLLIIPWLQGASGIAILAAASVLGGLISARRVAETLAHKITDMNPGQGFAANLTTALLVTTASVHGLPVSTTHVTVGSLLGIGTLTRQAKWRTVVPVLLSWLITLPCAALLGALALFMAHKVSGIN
jgi:inorganic phosphate transporter, PiT family